MEFIRDRIGSSATINEISALNHHTWQISAALVICISEAVLIAFLLVQQRKNRLSELKLSETRTFRDNLIRTANTLILGLDTKGNVTLLNPAAEKTTGYSKSELEDKNWFKTLVPEEQYQKIWQEFGRFIEEGLPKLCENHIVTKNGEIRTISWSHSRIKQDGQTAGVISIGIDITEHKQAEKLLKDSQKKYKEILDSTPDIRYQTDKEGHITFISKAVRRLAGYTEEEVLGQDITVLYLYPEERKKVLDILKRGDNNSDYEIQLKHKDGSSWWASANSQLYKDETGKVIGVEGIIRNITRRKVAEEKLRKNEERLRLALEGTNTGLYEWYPRSNETYFSPTFFTMLGYEPDQFPDNYHTWVSLLHPDDRSDAERIINKFITHRDESFKHKFRMRSQTGDYRWILSLGAAIEWDNNGASRIIGTHSDITDTKRSEEMLRDREMKMRAVFDQTFQFMGLLSLDGKVLTLNRVALEFIQAKEEDLINTTFWKTPWWRHSEREQKKLQETVRRAASGEYVSYETTNMDFPGVLHDIHFSLRPILDRDGKASYLCAEGKDITDRKKAQKKRKLLEKQLHQAQKMEAIGTLAGGIAHDFNNILGAIIGFSELALEDIKKGDPARYSIRQVSQSAFRAKELVKQILLFSRQGEQEMKPIKIAPLVKEVLKLLRATFQKSIEIRESIWAENDTVLADPTQIHQILMNLCTNSAHAMGEKGGMLMVTMSQIDLDEYSLMDASAPKAGSYLKLQVADTGHGVPEDVMDKIFDPFFTTKPRGEGTGLGLSVVHGIVKNHNGHIKILSEPQKGTCIQVFLPLLETECPEAVEEVTHINGGTEHILLVDDEVPLIEYGTLALQRLGYRITAFSDSRTAWETFRKTPWEFDMVITDKTMPRMNGMMLAEKIMALNPHIPIIMYTGFGDEISDEEKQQKGIREMLYKPVIKRELAGSIRKVFDQISRGDV